ncbi:helix-turn-helix transcriptional regulator [Streptomyces malaysiensis subsp. malaysiensis]|uniref:Helix-turn-helix domain-containing protein n=1 Tax=Streptomyces malaysiensis TaxID=92644 RepID=A0ABX6W0E4_STRMQ|nr:MULTISPECIES: helix-turn-helix domain-containing protein [Streptomyces]QPI54125.1 helix-turn-helix domain-containing protein [Streptomyces solisilvae]UHH15509.1 helix-turn-helix domain-containing protein [Streptomyces sp. HNM0561]
MPAEDELFSAVDALLEQVAQDDLPPPAERKRLREAAGLSQAEIARALDIRREAVGNWESGKTEPRQPKRAAYARLLKGLAARFPTPAAEVPGAGQAPAAPEPSPSARPTPTRPPHPGQGPSLGRDHSPVRSHEGPGASPAQGAPRRPATPPAQRSHPPRPSASRRPDARKPATAAADTTTAAPAVDPRFANGPLAVVDVADGEVRAYCPGGLVLDTPAKSLPSLVEWTLAEARLGAPRLNRNGRDADPVVALTDAAAVRFGLPARLTDEERRAGRLSEGHKVLEQLERADWRLTRRGLGPWARIYRPAEGSRRVCVQLCVLGWDALDARSWGGAAQLPPADLAHLLGTYADRVMTPCGSTAVTGLELMTALHPPTRAGEPDDSGRRHGEHNPGSLGTQPVRCAPPEAPDGHPLLAHLPRFHQRTPDEVLVEEAYDWARPLTDDECAKRYVVGIDVNMAFAAAANGTVFGLGEPVHVKRPPFDPKVPGSWLVDLSHIALDPRLPSPFTPTGERPSGPAWYATPTVAYAVELGYGVAPVEAYLRPDNGRYLDAWYSRLRDAYVATMADLGVTTGMGPREFLAAMDGHRQADPRMAIVLSAIKATVKGGIGKLRERPRGGGWRPGQPWPALQRPTWRPDIRAAVISKARINMHRKMLKMAAVTGQYPVAVLSDCAVYPSDGPGPLDFLPHKDGKPLPGGFRIGVSPGMVKHEGTQTTLWAEGVREEHGDDLNLARYIKDGQVTGPDNGE